MHILNSNEYRMQINDPKRNTIGRFNGQELFEDLSQVDKVAPVKLKGFEK